MHTTASDGRADAETMALAARANGLSYIAITDHSQSLAMANGLDERRTLEHALPRLMYVTVDSCNGPRAYAGLVSSYFEKRTANFQRLTDMEWSAQIMATPPADVAWMTGLVAR